MRIEPYLNQAIAIGSDVGLKILGALVLWIVGRWVIKVILRLVNRTLTNRRLDATVVHYVASFSGFTLNILLVVAVLGVFGVQTASFAAVLAAAGLAIGMAWSGLLANFAAGIFLLVLRPIKAGDFVEAGGVTGTVREIGILVATIDTLDNVRTIVGNKKIFEETAKNYSANPYRRVDLTAQLNHAVDHRQAMDLLRQRLLQIPHVLETPAPDLDILEFNLAGPVLAVRPYCSNDHYWDVLFASNAAIRETFGQANFPVPENHYAIRQLATRTAPVATKI